MDPLPLNQNTKGRQLIMERLVCLKRNKSQMKQHPSNTSTEYKVSTSDQSKNNKNLLNVDKSGTEEIALGNFEELMESARKSLVIETVLLSPFKMKNLQISTNLS